MRRSNVVTDRDIALLRSLDHTGSVVAASREVGISRDRAIYRLGLLERAFGEPVVRSERGGRGHGATALTDLGGRIARGGFDSVELRELRSAAQLAATNRLRGVYHERPHPEVEVPGGLRLRVAFAAKDGETVVLALDPESVLVARRKFASSARNVLTATVERVRRDGAIGRTLVLRVGRVRLRAAVTDEPVRQLGLAPGAKVVLYVKATALRRVRATTTRGSPRR
jgi:molybdate transport system regulatory protein